MQIIPYGYYLWYHLYLLQASISNKAIVIMIYHSDQTEKKIIFPNTIIPDFSHTPWIMTNRPTDCSYEINCKLFIFIL